MQTMPAAINSAIPAGPVMKIISFSMMRTLKDSSPLMAYAGNSNQ